MGSLSLPFLSFLSLMKYSHYQQDIFDFVKNGQGSATINAVPGSGKTTTLCGVSDIIPFESEALYMAFNKRVVTEMQLKGMSIDLGTSHKNGLAILRRHSTQMIDVKPNKYNLIANTYCDQLIAQKIASSSVSVAKLADIIRLTDTDIVSPSMDEILEDLRILVLEYVLLGIKEINEQLVSVLNTILNEGLSIYKTEAVIDYVDMLWIPLELDLPAPKLYDFLLIDEVQDFNTLQIELAQRLVYEDGRVIAVGDTNQSCYAFMGANPDSVDCITNAFNSQSLPLSICYRCPQSHINLASAIYPGIEASDDAIEGSVRRVYAEDIVNAVPNDMVLSRDRLSLVSAYLGMDKQQRYIASDFSSQLTYLLGEVFREMAGWDRVAIERYGEKKFKEFEERYNYPEFAFKNTKDNLDTLVIIYNVYKPQTLEHFIGKIKTMFKPIRDSVKLSTIHGAKGLEADNVYLLNHDKLPLKVNGQPPNQEIQESNLLYIAYTRAKSTLNLCYAE